jgi:hypothetical protein
MFMHSLSFRTVCAIAALFFAFLLVPGAASNGYAWAAPGDTSATAGFSSCQFGFNDATDGTGIAVQWQCSAAVYSQFDSDCGSLNVKSVDEQDGVNNTDPAGTPQSFKSSLIQGACGRGGSDYIGTRSAAVTVSPAYEAPPSKL